MTVEYTPNSSVSHLHIKHVEVNDEALYKCEKTYLEVRENCDVVQIIKLKTLVRPQSVRILSRDGSALGNATKLGPLNEGTEVELECEAAGAKPIPKITWYNGTNLMDGAYTSEVGSYGVGTARNKLRMTVWRGDLFAEYKCVVESDALTEPIVSWLTADIHVRPTKLELSGVKSHVVQGTNVLLRCNAVGARPAATIKWFNGTEPISEDMIETSPVLTDDGTYITQSELVFAASRYENGQTLICEAENSVLLEQSDGRPLRQKLTLEVLYPPIVTVNPENITVNESTEVLLGCSYVANPKQLDSVKWYKSGQLLTINEEHHEGGTTETPSLTIKNVTRDDSGEYSCELRNIVGSQESWNAVALNVLFKPVVELKMEPSNIVKSLDRINVTLLCDVVAGNPDTLLRVQWYLNGELLKELSEENCTNDVNSDRTFCELDPSKMLLEYVTEKFAGNYSCRAMNEAGWGPLSNDTELIVYYPPSQALVRYEPTRVIKKSAVTLYCAVEEPGRPADTQYMWLRGGHVVHNATSPKWTIHTVTFEADSNFTCIAYNEGGQGPPGTVNIEVLAPPAFIMPLQPYTGALMKATNISIACRIECSPMCTVTWLKNGKPLENNNLYYINETFHPPDLRTYDFESIQSVLKWNMSAWPNQQLNRINDNANYTCQSSSNEVGPGVTSTTLFAVEYPPENMTVSNSKVQVIENHIPERVICNAKAHPEVSYTWHRESHSDVISKGNALMLGAVTRAAAGNYLCRAFNRHGHDTYKVSLDVLYKPECAITQTERNGNPALVCTAHANPKEMSFTWKVKGMNETPEDMRLIEQDGTQSFLILDSSVDTLRTYQCYANNSIGFSAPCERDVAGTIAWWKRIDQDNLLIIIAIIVGIIVCVIIVCIIIIIVCRRKRANNKYNNPVELEEREKPDGQSPDTSSQSKWPLKPGVLVHVNRMHNLNMRNFSQLSLTRSDIKAARVFPKPGRRYRNLGTESNVQSHWTRLKRWLGVGDPDALPIGVYHGASGVVTFKKINTSTPTRVEPTTVSRKRKKPGQGPNPSNTADKNGNPTGNSTDPLADPENKTFYENLPFHGMQNPPNKPVSIIAPFVQDNVTTSLNTSSKSLVQIPNATNATQNKIQRNQSFHGFQNAVRMSAVGNIVKPNSQSPELGRLHLDSSHLRNPHLGNPRSGNLDVGNLQLGNPNMRNSQLGKPNFGNPHLENPHLKDSQLKNSHLENPDLTNTGLGNPHLENTRFGNSQLGNSNFGNPQLGNTSFGNSQLGNSNFGNSHLGNSSFGYPRVGNPNLGFTNEGNSKFRSVNAGSSKFSTSNLLPANLLPSKIISSNTIPSNKISPNVSSCNKTPPSKHHPPCSFPQKYGLSNLIYSQTHAPNRAPIGPLIVNPSMARLSQNPVRGRNPFLNFALPVRAPQFPRFPPPNRNNSSSNTKIVNPLTSNKKSDESTKDPVETTDSLKDPIHVLDPANDMKLSDQTKDVLKSKRGKDFLKICELTRGSLQRSERSKDTLRLSKRGKNETRNEKDDKDKKEEKEKNPGRCETDSKKKKDVLKTCDRRKESSSEVIQKPARRCIRKFDSFEHPKHKCNSPMFYSVRCRKHGKKKTVVELYALPSKQRKSSAPSEPSHTEQNASQPEDEALYQNLTDSIQILEQNQENSLTEAQTSLPKPAPRCRKPTNNVIYQNIAFLLKVTPEKKCAETNTDDELFATDKLDDTGGESKLIQDNETNESNENKVLQDDKGKEGSDDERICEKEKATDDVVNEDVEDVAKSDAKDDCSVPKEVKAELANIPGLKRPIPIKPKDIPPPVFVPKMPLIDVHKKWTNSLNSQNPFYTLTAAQVGGMGLIGGGGGVSAGIGGGGLFSSTFPHPRRARGPPAPGDTTLAKSKSFSSRVHKHKRPFQVPLHKCHSFKLQTAESYFQPIKNAHEQVLMRNGCEQPPGVGTAASRSTRAAGTASKPKERRSGASVVGGVTAAAHDSLRYRDHVPFHSSVQLQYPQPLYARAPAPTGPGALPPNGVVYADLDMGARTADESARAVPAKPHTEYATLKFNDVGQEIDV